MLAIIYFTSGSTVEDKDKAAIASIKEMLSDNFIKGRVYIRNARYVHSVEEYADGVAGWVPDCYKLHNGYMDAISDVVSCKSSALLSLDDEPAPESEAEKVIIKRRGRQAKC